MCVTKLHPCCILIPHTGHYSTSQCVQIVALITLLISKLLWWPKICHLEKLWRSGAPHCSHFLWPLHKRERFFSCSGLSTWAHGCLICPLKSFPTETGFYIYLKKYIYFFYTIIFSLGKTYATSYEVCVTKRVLPHCFAFLLTLTAFTVTRRYSLLRGLYF